jgi:hypothetical protein
MINIIETKPVATVKMTDRSIVAACPLGISLRGTGMSGRLSSLSSAVLPVRERSERPAVAPAVAVAAVAQVQAYAFAATTNGAETGTENHGNASQKTQHNPKWAFRGLEPWSDPV